jgi:hypothetical protein
MSDSARALMSVLVFIFCLFGLTGENIYDFRDLPDLKMARDDALSRRSRRGRATWTRNDTNSNTTLALHNNTPYYRDTPHSYLRSTKVRQVEYATLPQRDSGRVLDLIHNSKPITSICAQT